MQELPLILDINRGLNPDPYGFNSRNSNFVTDIKGFRVDQYGLRNPRAILDPFNGLVTKDYPFPQLSKGVVDKYLFYRNRVENVDDSWNRSSLTLTPTNGSDSSIIEGGVWHYADLGGAFYATNGSSVVFKTGLDTLFNMPIRYWIENSFKINTITSHMGRVVIGGPTTEAWGYSIQDTFSSMLACIGDGLFPSTNDVKKNWVIWSSIGGGDFPLWLFYPQEYPIESRPTIEMLQDRIARGDFGWSIMPYSGEVYKLASLRKALISYGSDGIAVMNPVIGSGDIPATFGIELLSSVGIYSRSSVNGNRNVHYFLDNYGELWRLTASLELTNLGYRDVFSSWISNNDNIVFTYDDLENELHITNGSSSYVLNQGTDLVESSEVYTWMLPQGGQVYGTYQEPSSELTYKTICSSKFDAFRREDKTITSVNCEIETDGLVEVSFKYKYNLKDEWNQTSWTRLNNEGNAALRITASEFIFCLRVSNDTYFNLGRVTMKAQYGDKRFSRGPNQGTNLSRDVN